MKKLTSFSDSGHRFPSEEPIFYFTAKSCWLVLFVSIISTIFTINSSHSLLMSFTTHKMYDSPHCVQVSEKVHPFNLLCCFSLIFAQLSSFFCKESFRRLTSGIVSRLRSMSSCLVTESPVEFEG